MKNSCMTILALTKLKVHTNIQTLSIQWLQCTPIKWCAIGVCMNLFKILRLQTKCSTIYIFNQSCFGESYSILVLAVYCLELYQLDPAYFAFAFKVRTYCTHNPYEILFLTTLLLIYFVILKYLTSWVHCPFSFISKQPFKFALACWLSG